MAVLTSARSTSARRGRPWPWLPVVVLAAIMVPGLLLSPTWKFDPPGLLPALNLVFQTFIPLLTAVVAVVVYRRSGVAAVLALGAGMLATAVGCGILPAILLIGAPPNVGITVHNGSAAIAAVGHFVAAIGGIAGVTLGPARTRHVLLAYGLVALAVGFLLVSSITGLLPPFWADGPTALRVGTLEAGALLFGMSAFAWWQTAMRDRSIRFLRWYVPGLTLFAMGLAVMVGNGVLGGVLSWLGRTGQYLGAVYLLLAVVPEVRVLTGRQRVGDERALGVALLQAALPFRPLVESTSDAVVAVGGMGRVLYWNEAARRLFGYSADEAFDSDPVDLVCPDPRAEDCRTELHRLLTIPTAHGSGERRELELADRFGRTFVAEVAAFAGSEDPRLVVAVITDVTARVRARAELERLVLERTEELARANAELESANDELESANADLERANASKDEFLGLVSHELKTPITSILAASSILERRADEDGLAKDVGAEAIRLGGIVDNLLAIARLDSGTSADFEPLPLERVARASVAAVLRQYPGRDVEITAEHGVIVEGNEEQLAMVLRNYIGNALKYSPADSAIQVVLGQDRGRARLAVLDRGPGVAEEEAALLFEPFHRGGRTESVPGIGIGLTVCRRVVEVHGGTVGAASRHDGPGSIFWFELPLALEGVEREDADPALAGVAIEADDEHDAADEVADVEVDAPSGPSDPLVVAPLR